MNDLQILQAKGTMTSLEIAEITGKEHKNVLADIRDEISKLGTERAELIFQPSKYKDANNQNRPMFIANVQGILQLGARYSADVRYRLIEKVTKKETVETKEDIFKNDLLDIEKDKIRLEKSRILKELSQSFTNEKYRETLQIYSANALYDKPILELPTAEKKSYSASELSQLMMNEHGIKISGNRIGRLTNEHNLKTDEYGYWALDKSRHTNKQVESFRYYDNIIEEIRKYI
ncbi:Rha family transcriptional regulator [Leptotrichia buccalis]